MTIEEFNNHRFGAKDRFQHKAGGTYNLASVDFAEQLIGLDLSVEGQEDDEILLVRCENVQLL